MTKTAAERAYDNIHNEGGEGYNPIRANASAMIAAFEDKRADGAQARADKFAAIWTLEVTQQRRAEWNAFARTNMTPRGLPAKLANTRMAAQGWTTDDLRAAVKLHNL